MITNILEYTKSLLPQTTTDIPIYLNQLPLNQKGLLIEESGAFGRIDSFDGYVGVIQSTIQLYIRASENASYTNNMGTIKRYFKLVQASKGITKDNVKLLWVGNPTFSNGKDNQGNSYYSALFIVIYKESECV